METDDIRRIVETWSTTSRHWAPKEKDAEFLSKYLLQSVDRSKATDIVVESYCCYELVVSAFRVIIRFFFLGRQWQQISQSCEFNVRSTRVHGQTADFVLVSFCSIGGKLLCHGCSVPPNSSGSNPLMCDEVTAVRTLRWSRCLINMGQKRTFMKFRDVARGVRSTRRADCGRQIQPWLRQSRPVISEWTAFQRHMDFCSMISVSHDQHKHRNTTLWVPLGMLGVWKGEYVR